MSSPTSLVITGCSTGIGRALVAKSVKEGANVFANVRTQADADALKRAHGDAVIPLIFDVRDEPAVKAAAATTAAALAGQTLSALVNNAGVALLGPLLHLESDELRDVLEVNLVGVHAVTRAFAPLLGAVPNRSAPPGRIVMISSVAGVVAVPFVSAYVTSKHALEGYAVALRRELMIYGIDVVVVGPGGIKTAIWDKTNAQDLSRFGNTIFADVLTRLRAHMVERGKLGRPAEDVADLVWTIITSERPKTRYTIANRTTQATMLMRALPQRWADRLLARSIGIADAMRR